MTPSYLVQRARKAATKAARLGAQGYSVHVFIRGERVVIVSDARPGVLELVRQDRTARLVGTYGADASAFQIHAALVGAVRRRPA